MRNLKKFLALVLAMMMAMSLMVTANASQVIKHEGYTDTASITEFDKAIDALTGMGIFKGDKNGNFNPTETITRAEMAALIYRLRTGDVEDKQADLYREFGNFPDVNKDTAWYAGYVGFCANAEIIVGRADGRFDPSAKVTGYEAVAMMLRAVGYDRNGEFTGTTWRTEVASYAQRLGIIADLKNDHFEVSLGSEARRDVVARMLFSTARLPQVTWTSLLGYGGGYEDNGLAAGTQGASLGTQYFGLTPFEGLVYANQATNGGNRTTLSTGENLDLVTGLEEFGHKYTGWYDNRGSAKTYAAYDVSTGHKLIIVKGDSDNGDLSANGNLRKAITNAGWSVVDNKALLSAGFKTPVSMGSFATYNMVGNNVQSTTDDRLYLLVSNAGGGTTANVIVALNVTASTVTGVDDISPVKTITIPASELNTSRFVVDYNSDKHPALTDNTLVNLADRITIKQAALTNGTNPVNGTNAIASLNSYVVANAIGNGADKTEDDSTPPKTLGGPFPVNNYSVSKLIAKTVTVNSYHTADYASRDTFALNNDQYSNDYLETSAGRVYKSLLYYTVPSGANGVSVIPQQGTETTGGIEALTQDTYNTSTYTLYLDSDGRYVGAEPSRGEEFIYGTYADYNQPYATSTFEWTLVGLNEKGEQVKRTFTSHNGRAMSGTYGLANLNVNFHDFDGTTGNFGTGVRDVGYYGYVLSANGGNLCDPTNAPGLTPSDLGWENYPTVTSRGTDNIVIDRNSVNIGAALFDDVATPGRNLYLTERTQFYIVSGYGTDSAKATPYTGISKLLGSQSRVVIDLTSNRWNDGSNDVGYAPEIFYQLDEGYYANGLEYTAKEVKTVFIPEDAVWGMTNSYYFAPFGSAHAIATDVGNNYNKYMLFLNGEYHEYWLDAASSAAITAGCFYDMLIDTRLKTSGNEPVYSLPDSDADGFITAADAITPGKVNGVLGIPGLIDDDTNDFGTPYWPTTSNSQVAMINNQTQNDLYNVSNAKIVNLSGRLPGLNNTLTTLNYIASNAYQQTTAQAVRVWVQLEAPNSNVVTAIYVGGIGTTNPNP